MDISTYQSKKCPICDSKMVYSDSPPDTICVNNCIEIYVDYRENHAYQVLLVFDHDGDSCDGRWFDLPEDEDKLKERIEYWKKDYRYLAEMLERN